MSQSSWWTICRRNSTDDPPDGSCPECRHASLNHPGAHNPGLKACVICALDQLNTSSQAATLSMLSSLTLDELDALGGVEESA